MQVNHKKIKELRNATGLSLMKLEDKIKISAVTLQKLEKEKSNPTITTIKIIANFYNVDIEELIKKPL